MSSHAATLSDADYVGEYRGGSKDKRAQLALLDDNTFCFAFRAGAADLLMAGRWTAEGGGIRLKQVRPEQTLFPAFGRKVEKLGTMVEFDFHGQSLSSANGPVFAVSADDKVPTTLRPLFSQGSGVRAESYKLPPMPANAVRYFYLGNLVEATSGKPAVVQVVQYQLEDSNSVRVVFDQLQAMPLMDQRGEVRDDTLYMAGSRFGKRRPLASDTLNMVRAGCIQPALATSAPPAQPQGDHKPLMPGKAFTVSPSAIRGEPFFEAKGG